MCTRWTGSRECLTWDDLCVLWDDGVYTADDIKHMAPFYFEGAELSAVLDVIEKVASDSDAWEARKPDLGIVQLKYRKEAA